MKIGFFSPSYKRPEKSITQFNYPRFKMVVSKSEANEYEDNGNEVVVCPDKIQGNICRVRNWILDELMGDNDCVVVVDDDCSGIYYWKVNEDGAEKIMISNEELLYFCENSVGLCMEWGFKYWGVNCIGDKGAYREYAPFSTLNYVASPFYGVMSDNELRFDENLHLKEDYDYTLQHIFHNRGCLRFNMVTVNVKQSQQIGGCASKRNVKEEQRQFSLLQKKWGSDVVRQDGGSRREFDYNPILKIPLKGV